jgi:hypothetical protein
LLLALWVAFVLTLTLTALIPQSAVVDSVGATAEQYQNADMFEQLNPNDPVSVIHNYADAVLFNILWSQDSTHPFTSALDSALYQDTTGTQGQNLYAAVAGGQAANTSYARYWHGDLIVLKPLSCVLGLRGIRILGAAVFIALGGVCFTLLFRRKLWAAAVGLALGLVVSQVWLVPLCIEYYACFALMFLFSDVVLLWGKQLTRDAELFLAIGALTCFFDFLTCEILTLCVPLVCLLLVQREEKHPALRRTERRAGIRASQRRAGQERLRSRLAHRGQSGATGQSGGAEAVCPRVRNHLR